MNLFEQDDINDAIRDAICQVSLSYDVGPFATVALVDAVRDAVQEFLLDQQFEEAALSDEELYSEIDALLAEDVEDASPFEVDPEVLLANAEEFISGCERADFLTEQYGEHFLKGVRDRLTVILADHG